MTAALAARLAWRQLLSNRARLVSAIAGVTFACVLVFMQLGFRAALFESASNLPRALKGELFLVNPLTLVMFRPEPIARVRASQVLADPDVALSVPIYLAQTKFRNPDTGRQRTIQLIGFDPEAGAVSFQAGSVRLMGGLPWAGTPRLRAQARSLEMLPHRPSRP